MVRDRQDNGNENGNGNGTKQVLLWVNTIVTLAVLGLVGYIAHGFETQLQAQRDDTRIIANIVTELSKTVVILNERQQINLQEIPKLKAADDKVRETTRAMERRLEDLERKRP